MTQRELHLEPPIPRTRENIITQISMCEAAIAERIPFRTRFGTAEQALAALRDELAALTPKRVNAKRGRK